MNGYAYIGSALRLDFEARHPLAARLARAAIRTWRWVETSWVDGAGS